MARSPAKDKAEIDERFADAVITAREQLGLNKRELAAAAGVDGAQLTRLEQRDRSVRLATAVALAKTLGLSLDEIAHLDGNPVLGDLDALRRRLRPKASRKKKAPTCRP